MRLRALLVLWLSALASGGVVASSGGSPICHADDIIASPMGFSAPLGYGVVADPPAYTPGQALTISLLPGSSYTVFTGLLLYVEDQDDLDEEMRPRKAGDFIAPLASGLQFKTGCIDAGDQQVITHANANDRSMPRSFLWDAPTTAQGTLHLRAIVLKKTTDFSNAVYELFTIELPLDPVFADEFE